MKRIRLLRGLRTAKTRPSASTPIEDMPARSVALTGADTHGLRPSFEVEPGAHVGVGDCLFVDRADIAVRYASPIAGHVVSTEYGSRRTLSSVIVKADPHVENGQRDAAKPLDVGDGKAIREALLHFGLWPALRSKPFGRVPPSTAVPHAVVVSAVNPGLLAPDPATVVGERQADFDAGLMAIASLDEGSSDFPIFVCQSDKTPLATSASARVQTVQFVGSHLAALPSTHVYQLAPARIDAPVWTIGYQDVLAIGTLVLHGRYDSSRLVAVASDSTNTTRLVRTALGANLRSLLGGSGTNRAMTQTFSGSVWAHRTASYLGRYDMQASVRTETHTDKPKRWLRQLSTLQTRTPAPLISNMAMDAVLPANVLAVPLMRALAVGDIEAAMRLGALDLVEEDVAPLSRICPSGADYPALLRSALDTIAQDYT